MCMCVCVCFSVCIIIIINIIFFCILQEAAKPFRDIVGSRDKKIEINQITKLTKREKIVSWSNRVYRSIEGDVLRSSITTGHETNPFHSSPVNLSYEQWRPSSRGPFWANIYEYFSLAKEKNENRNYENYDQRYADRIKKLKRRFVSLNRREWNGRFHGTQKLLKIDNVLLLINYL